MALTVKNLGNWISGSDMDLTLIKIKNWGPVSNQKSMDWGAVDAFDFFPFAFFPPFLFIFFLGFSSETGCVLCKCWWMDPRGSDWKAGWLRTVLNCFASFNLIGTKQLSHYNSNRIMQRKWGEKLQYWRTHINFCLDLQLNLNSAAVFGCWGAFNPGRNSVSDDRSYAFNFFCRLRSFFWMNESDLLV